MPIYSFVCECGASRDAVLSMDAVEERARMVCLACGKVMVREYRPPTVHPDSFGHPLVLDTLPPLRGSGPSDVVDGKSELKDVLRKHNEQEGWGLTMEV